MSIISSLFQKGLKNEYLVNGEVSSSVFVPYEYHYTKDTIITKENWLLKVIKLDGFSFETADDEDVDMRKRIRNNLWKGLSGGTLSVYTHIIRRKVKVNIDSEKSRESLENSTVFARYLDKKWQERYSQGRHFVNDLYITIIRKPDTGGIAKFESWFKNFKGKTNKQSFEKDLLESFQELEEMTGRVINSLRDYNPRLLSCFYHKGKAYSEILEFLGSLVNCGFSCKSLVPRTDISTFLPNHRLYFHNRHIEAKGILGTRYGSIVSIKDYGQNTHAGMLDGFLQMPFEFILSQSFMSSNRAVAITQMQLQQNRMIQADDKAVSQIAQITAALDMAMSGTIGFGKHHLTVLSIADSIKNLENYTSMAASELANTGGAVVREVLNMEPAYWAQLPGNNDLVVRGATINTLNLASFTSLHNYPAGKRNGNHWGDAVTILDTTSGTPYYFNFHVRDVGHTTIIGPTGAGKTVLMNFLCAQAQRFGARMFFFDKDRGAEIFIRSIGGNYTVLHPGGVTGFNPLQLDNDGPNKSFIKEWLEIITTINGEKLSAEERDLIDVAVKGNYKLLKKDRRLSNVIPFLGVRKPGSLAGRAAVWCEGNNYGGLFDNLEDNLDFSSSNTFGFEMAPVFEDKKAMGPLLSYIFHRIQISLDGTPTIIVLDEAWALIDNEIFAHKIKDWLKVLRKLNALVIFATQSVEDASKSDISDTLIQQTATQIFLPNLKATAEYKTAFMLSEREFSLIKTTDPSSRFFLVKQANNAVVARIDLSGFEDVVSVLSARSDTVRILDDIISEHGDDPDVFVPIFWEKVL